MLEKFKLNQKVKVLLDNEVIKEGIIIGLSKTFVQVYQEYNKKTNVGDPLKYGAEWFAKESKRIRVV